MRFERAKILVVDDDPLLTDLLQLYLENHDYDIHIAYSGEEAIEKCMTFTPDLILLDVIMPGMDGIETCRRLKRLPALTITPIVMITGSKNEKAIHLSFDAGASDFLTKPVNKVLLNKRVEYCLRSCLQYKVLKSREKELYEAQKIARLGTFKLFTKDKSIQITTKSNNLLGFESNDINLSFSDFIKHVHPDDTEHVKFSIEHAIKNESHYLVEYRFITESDEIIIYQQGEFIKDDSINNKSYLIGSFQDVTESRDIKDLLDYSRYYDRLTDLTNRSFFESQIRHTLRHPPQDALFAVVFIGIDNFSLVNDEMGHSGGDSILKEIANRLLHFEKRGFIISRFGGDVFSVLIQNIHHIEECSRLLQKFLTVIRTPIHYEADEIHLTASIGVSVFPLESDDTKNLLIGAEAAMMLSSENGGDCYTYRTYSMNVETQKKLFILKELRTAVINKDFSIYYQPQYDTNKMQIIGMEALVRWIHQDKGLISPLDFIPIAEESGLIIPIGDYVLEQSCKQTQIWRNSGFDISIAVNISALQFDDIGFISKIKQTLENTGLPANNLEIEITESMAMKDHIKTIDVLQQLRDMGVNTSIDDFGTGYSSLSKLQILPLDTLKVDQTFIKCIKLAQDGNNTSYENTAIANAIISMSHSLGLKVVAEGVETKDQCEFLKKQKIEILQGFLFSKPVTTEVFEKMLFKQKHLNETSSSTRKISY